MIITKKIKVKRSKLLCSHRFMRGERSGKFCEEPALIGYRKCRQHHKKSYHQAKFANKMEKILGDLLLVKLYKNEFGEWEDKETGFIFDYDSHKVLGKRTDKRELENLKIMDIHLTVKRGWDIHVPDNIENDTTDKNWDPYESDDE